MDAALEVELRAGRGQRCHGSLDVAVNGGAITLALAGTALIVPLAWLSLRLVRLPVRDTERVVGELRLAQMGALTLGFIAGASAGIAVTNLQAPGAGLELALAVGFLALAGGASLREPPEALTWIALGFLAHAALDVLPRPGLLGETPGAGRFARDCAVANVILAAVCYLPVFRRQRS